MDAQTMLLGFLMTGGRTGYELKKAFAISFSFFSDLSYGSIYPALKKMEKAGWVTMAVAVQDGSPNRKIYTITDAGRTAFMAELRAPFQLERFKNAFLTRLFFFSHLTPEERLAAAVKHLAAVQQAYEALKAVESEVASRADKFQFLCYRFGLRLFEDLTRNVAEIVDALEKDTVNPTDPAEQTAGSQP